MKLKYIASLLLIISSFCAGQIMTVVTGTITDPSGQAFISGSVQADYHRPQGRAGTKPQSNGQPIVEHGAQNFAVMDATGTFSLAIADLQTVSPAGGSWVFTLCPFASGTCSVVTSQAVTGTTIDLGASLSNGVAVITVVATPALSKAYQDKEIVIAPGVIWLDVVANQIKYMDALGNIYPITGGTSGNALITNPTQTSQNSITPQNSTTQALTLNAASGADPSLDTLQVNGSNNQQQLGIQADGTAQVGNGSGKSQLNIFGSTSPSQLWPPDAYCPYYGIGGQLLVCNHDGRFVVGMGGLTGGLSIPIYIDDVDYNNTQPFTDGFVPTYVAALKKFVVKAPLSPAAACIAAGSAASPSIVACGSATKGSFSCAPNATGATCTVQTTAVTGTNQIFIQPSTAETIPAVTCNASADTSLAVPRLTSRVVGTSFTITLGTFATNPMCFEYTII